MLKVIKMAYERKIRINYDSSLEQKKAEQFLQIPLYLIDILGLNVTDIRVIANLRRSSTFKCNNKPKRYTEASLWKSMGFASRDPLSDSLKKLNKLGFLEVDDDMYVLNHGKINEVGYVHYQSTYLPAINFDTKDNLKEVISQQDKEIEQLKAELDRIKSVEPTASEEKVKPIKAPENNQNLVLNSHNTFSCDIAIARNELDEVSTFKNGNFIEEHCQMNDDGDIQKDADEVLHAGDSHNVEYLQVDDEIPTEEEFNIAISELNGLEHARKNGAREIPRFVENEEKNRHIIKVFEEANPLLNFDSVGEGEINVCPEEESSLNVGEIDTCDELEDDSINDNTDQHSIISCEDDMKPYFKSQYANSDEIKEIVIDEFNKYPADLGLTFYKFDKLFFLSAYYIYRKTNGGERVTYDALNKCIKLHKEEDKLNAITNDVGSLVKSIVNEDSRVLNNLKALARLRWS